MTLYSCLYLLENNVNKGIFLYKFSKNIRMFWGILEHKLGKIS